MLERYLSMLRERGLIRVENVESTFKYFTTDKGRKFLREYEKLEKILIQTI